MSFYYVSLALLLLLPRVRSEPCPDSPSNTSAYSIVLNGTTYFSVDASGTCSCSRFSGELDSPFVQNITATISAMNATMQSLVSELDSLKTAYSDLSQQGQIDSNCSSDADCRRTLVCELSLHRCKGDVGARCADCANCTSELVCIDGLCTAADVLYAWGDNQYGQLGDNTTTDRWVATPMVRPGSWNARNVTAIAAGTFHSMALLSDGVLYSWGANSYGQLGDNTNINRWVPTPVTGPASWNGQTVMAIAVGDYHSMALLSDGLLYAWGSNAFFQLGDNNTVTANRFFPTLVVRPASWTGRNVTAIAAGNYHSMALLSDGMLYAWGGNPAGQLGDNTAVPTRSVATAVVRPVGWNGRNVTAIAAGGVHSMALLSDGVLYAWGFNAYGQLGDNTTVNRLFPTPVVRPPSWNGRNVTAIAAGTVHSMALLSDGMLYAWGGNQLGQLGDSTASNRSVPTPVVRPLSWNGRTVIAFEASYYHSLALLSDGVLYAWGTNQHGYGLLGLNTTSNAFVPTPVVPSASWNGRKVTAIAAGAFHSMAALASSAR